MEDARTEASQVHVDGLLAEKLSGLLDELARGLEVYVELHSGLVLYGS